MDRRKKRRLLVLDGILIITLIIGVFLFQRLVDLKEKNAAAQTALDQKHASGIIYNGDRYPVKYGLMSVLLIGTERYPEDERPDSGKGSGNGSFADFLVLLVFDHNRKTLTPIHICADTLCKTPGDSAENNKYQKIGLTYSFGKSNRNGCTNICKAVEELLYGAPVDHYAAIDMQAIPLVNDVLGGITIKLQDDFSALGSEFQRGNSVTLQGSEALAYISRQEQESMDSHALRRARQQHYLDALIGNISQTHGVPNLLDSSVRETIAKDPKLSETGIKGAADYLCTDLSMSRLTDLFKKAGEYEVLPSVSVKGDYQEGNDFCFRADDASLWECVRSTFCQ